MFTMALSPLKCTTRPMPAPSIEKLVNDANATIGDLRAFTKDSGGRTRLLWTKNLGAVNRNEAVILCATNPNDAQALIDLANRLWGPNANEAIRRT